MPQTHARAGRLVLRKILVVDDNEDNRELLVFRLKHLGNFDIQVAGNGKEALETVARSRPDLILMDLKMPVMDGWEATRMLRQTECGRDLPVIAVTAHDAARERLRAMEAGCNDFIPKPILDYSVVHSKIQKFLG